MTALKNTNGEAPKWTESEDKILREMHSTHSASEIREVLHWRSRSAICGRAFRLGLGKLQPPTVKRVAKEPKPVVIPRVRNTVGFVALSEEQQLQVLKSMQSLCRFGDCMTKIEKNTCYCERHAPIAHGYNPAPLTKRGDVSARKYLEIKESIGA